VLICVIPVDLVLPDLEEIEQMFVEEEYMVEQTPKSYDEWVRRSLGP